MRNIRPLLYTEPYRFLFDFLGESMKKISNCFRISVDELPENVISLMNQNFDMKAETPKRYLLEDHIVEIYTNEDYDEVLSLVDEDDYLYYRCHMDFIPIEFVCIIVILLNKRKRKLKLHHQGR